MAPVPAAEDGGELQRNLPKSLLQILIDGTRATLANHGVAQTLRGIRRGSNALTMTHAAANLPEHQLMTPPHSKDCTYSTTTLLPTSPTFHHLSLLATPSSPSHPLFLNHFPKTSTPLLNHAPSLMYGGNHWV